jgi:hypothetical protein
MAGLMRVVVVNDLQVKSLAISNGRKQIYELAHFPSRDLRYVSYQSPLYPVSYFIFIIVIQSYHQRTKSI